MFGIQKAFYSFLIATTLLTGFASTTFAQQPEINKQSLDSFMTKRPRICFQTNRKSIIVNELLTKEQKQLLMQIKASSAVIDRLRLQFSIENRIKYCLENSININGFQRVANPIDSEERVSIDSNYQLISNFNQFVLVNSNKQKIQATALVNVNFNPAIGYTVKVEVN